MDEIKANEERAEELNKKKRARIIIIAVFALALVLLLVCTLLPSLINKGEKKTELPKVDPSKLWETKEEGFDIMEYEGYLKQNRTVMYSPYAGMTVEVSVDSESVREYGKDAEFVYNILMAVIAGDYETYNSMVSEEIEHYGFFTQQQLYDMSFQKLSQTDKGGYTEYAFRVSYKIHENNGSFRDDIEPDAGRDQYYIINDKSGELKLANISYYLGDK